MQRWTVWWVLECLAHSLWSGYALLMYAHLLVIVVVLFVGKVG